ncbi:MAG TPA: hypothetical protein PKA84_03940 [Rubrivivax sp.]|nr:hypothetical protein [Rubrivivax sp.]HMR69363.1 hypothetical protein [Rubrivivax sp.]
MNDRSAGRAAVMMIMMEQAGAINVLLIEHLARAGGRAWDCGASAGGGAAWSSVAAHAGRPVHRLSQ